MTVPVVVRPLGNAGVELHARPPRGAPVRVYIDAFFHGIPGVGSDPVLSGDRAEAADLLLVTHAHFDHFLPDGVVRAAHASGAVVAGPRAVVAELGGRLPPEKLLALEPPTARPYASVDATVGPVSVRAYRTRHGSGHNSYLVEFAGRRFLHDGDNEATRRYDVAALGRVDALFLCPWQGSGAGAFVRALAPGRWFLIHLTEEEAARHRRGEFLPDLLAPDEIPEGVLAPAPGERLEI